MFSISADVPDSRPEGRSLSLTAAPQLARAMVGPRIRYYSRVDFERMPQATLLGDDERFAIRVVSTVLPFKVNSYVLDRLIDWNRIPDDPIYRLTFPHRDMLDPDDFSTMARLVKSNAPANRIREAANAIRRRLNPHPSGQMEHNVPTLDGVHLRGLQHKYGETVLYFPMQGQTCHTYCTFCFRWAQFVGSKELRFASRDPHELTTYLRRHREVTDVLITGGDPMTMPAPMLRQILEPLLSRELEHVQNIRIGTKSLAYWPHRYVSDEDSDEILQLFKRIVRHGRHLSLMAHNNHFRELDTPVAQRAIERVRDTGAVIRCQSPLVRHINDDAAVWTRMWKTQVRLGCVPYYMFVERDTGPRRYFEVSLARAVDIFSEAYRQVSGLARTVRGPSMSATPGKVMIDGVARVGGEKVFALHFIQARDPSWVNRPFFARFDPNATWLDHLRPAFGADRFFYEPQATDPAAQSADVPR